MSGAVRLRRADPGGPGLTRRRCGRGWRYLDGDGAPVDPVTRARIEALAIPPAWGDVWICPEPNGHLQATGVDQAGRRQYLYHAAWHVSRGRRKFELMVAFARRLPELRASVEAGLARPELDRERVLACAVRLLDLGFFRIGSESYAELNGTFGLATLRREHVTVAGEAIVCDYLAKGGIRREHRVVDPAAAEVVAALRRRRGGGDELLAHREGRRWVDVRSADVNAWLKEHAGDEASAKTFRTWQGTVLAALALAVAAPAARSRTARRRAAARAAREVAHHLGNTPAVARRSYIDPRVIDRFDAGLTIGGAIGPELAASRDGTPFDPIVEQAVLDLLEGDRSSPLVQRPGELLPAPGRR